MANTKSSAKRARQSKKKQLRNKMVRSTVKSALKIALETIQSKEADNSSIQAAYMKAVRTLSKAASKGVLPKTRVSRKISKLTHFSQRIRPEALSKQA